MIGAAQTTGAAEAAPTFDPAAWLAQFEAVGGWYAMKFDHLSLGWYVGDHPDEHQAIARKLYRQVEEHGPEREALHNMLIDRAAEALGLGRILNDFMMIGGRLIMRNGKVQACIDLADVFGSRSEQRRFEIWADMQQAVRDHHDTLARRVAEQGVPANSGWLVMEVARG
ncbi:hypothetical protein [Sphingomonas sanxanigenens]|uniref:Uncharacterized protein n=1 Tax=Sphingomonas sanxanigenens DSM 19645 = NX02 TaxID=1123269 RepID=W0A8J6_9SPHN|nr:hypothetical protein [Sphingomonas sanxanigenens]AHE52812.1 hypothetical protein NX02_05365 [Sphingomonas sanxanigenens DSM 19645 = NX02]